MKNVNKPKLKPDNTNRKSKHKDTLSYDFVESITPFPGYQHVSVNRKMKPQRFVQVAESNIYDVNLSDKSFRLYMYLMSKSGNYKINMKQLEKTLYSGKTLRACFKELQSLGLLIKINYYEYGTKNAERIIYKVFPERQTPEQITYWTKQMIGRLKFEYGQGIIVDEATYIYMTEGNIIPFESRDEYYTPSGATEYIEIDKKDLVDSDKFSATLDSLVSGLEHMVFDYDKCELDESEEETPISVSPEDVPNITGYSREVNDDFSYEIEEYIEECGHEDESSNIDNSEYNSNDEITANYEVNRNKANPEVLATIRNHDEELRRDKHLKVELYDWKAVNDNFLCMNDSGNLERVAQ
ncbi:hypothetical protein COE58_22780 [Bacillus cereus]|nr:hypothetical protein COL13_14740 [Bacillus cereus]PGZ58531.1 hypothetical protein COE58_22780 [Bacillus cereus]